MLGGCLGEEPRSGRAPRAGAFTSARRRRARSPAVSDGDKRTGAEVARGSLEALSSRASAARLLAFSVIAFLTVEESEAHIYSKEFCTTLVTSIDDGRRI